MNMSLFCSSYSNGPNSENDSSIYVLFIDDELAILNSIKRSFRGQFQFTLFTAASIVEARQILLENKIDIIVTDYLMPDMDGVSFAKDMRKCYPQIPVLLMTGQSGLQSLSTDLVKDYISSIITKPWSNIELFQKILTIYASSTTSKQ